MNAEQVPVREFIERRNQQQQDQEHTSEPGRGPPGETKVNRPGVSAYQHGTPDHDGWLPIPSRNEEFGSTHTHTDTYTRLKITIQTASTKCQYIDTAPRPDICFCPKSRLKASTKSTDREIN